MKGLNPIILLQGSFSDQNLYLLFYRMTVHSPCKMATYPALDNTCATRLPLTQHLQLSDMQLLRSFSYAVFLLSDAYSHIYMITLIDESLMRKLYFHQSLEHSSLVLNILFICSSPLYKYPRIWTAASKSSGLSANLSVAIYLSFCLFSSTLHGVAQTLYNNHKIV